MGHKGEPCKSIKNALYGVAKGTSRAEATLNSERMKPVALTIVKLRESEGISQAGRQLVSQSVSQ